MGSVQFFTGFCGFFAGFLQDFYSFCGDFIAAFLQIFLPAFCRVVMGSLQLLWDSAVLQDFCQILLQGFCSIFSGIFAEFSLD